MKFAVIYKGSYYEAPYDQHDTGHTSYYPTITEFDTKEALLRWIENEDNSKYSSKKPYRVIQFDELKVTKTVQFDLT